MAVRPPSLKLEPAKDSPQYYPLEVIFFYLLANKLLCEIKYDL